MVRTLVSISSLAIALLAAQSANAQVAVQPVDTSDESQSPAGGAEQAAGTQGAALGDIIVTANKRSQGLQKTPAAITAISSELIVQRGVSDLRAAQALVPSVRFQQQATSTEVYIRGIGATLDQSQIDPPTSVNFNGIYMPREVTSAAFFDVNQIEVLPGPQGTLYGRSSLGGVVNINFNRPTQEDATSFNLEAGNYALLHLTAVQNLSLTSNLAVRAAFDFNRHTGYLKSGAESRNGFNARLSFLYTPTDRVSIYAWGMVGDEKGVASNAVAIGIRPDGTVNAGSFLQDDPWNDLLPPSVLAQSPYGQPAAKPVKDQKKIFGGEVEAELSDSVTLTYIPSYLEYESAVAFTLSGLPNIQTTKYNQTTHELRLSGDAGWGNWLIGGYGYRLRSSGQFYVGSYDFTGFPVTLVDRNRIKGLAIFGQATLNIYDALRLTVGGRYGVDNRVGEGPYLDNSGSYAPYDFRGTYRRFDYKVSIEYDIAPRAMVYAAVQTGFQPGTFNTYASTPTVDNAVDPAKLTAYTAGLKSRIWGDVLQFNTEFFYYDYRNLIGAAYNALLSKTEIFNAGKTEVYGLQNDLVFKPSSRDQLTLSVGYLHARYKDFKLPDGSADYSGNQLQFAPDWTVNAGYHHDFDMPEGYIRADVSGRFDSQFYGDFRHTPGTRQKPYVKADASLTYYSNDGRWNFGAWIKNITNEVVYATTAGGTQFPLSATGGTGFLESPRTFGIRAGLNF